MKFTDGVNLISHPALKTTDTTQWADLGCGAGFFTGVLSSLLITGSTIYAADTDARAVKNVKVAEGIHLKTYILDFAKQPLPFDKIDGIMLANAIHYVRDKIMLLQKLKQHLNDKGNLLIVEYDTGKSNPWVPYPITFDNLKEMCLQQGFSTVEKINQMPSAFGRSNLYAALVKI